MVAEDISVGSRIDLLGSKGTVRYVGELINTEGSWLGVDWDDPLRGKHCGTYNGHKYFETSYPTSGSFVRPNKVNAGVSIIEAIKDRYGMTNNEKAILDEETINQIKREIKANVFEVVGVEKLNEIQSDFKNLQVVLLRDLYVNGAGPPAALLRLCPSIVELDLSKTLINTWETVGEIALQLKHLKILNLSDNRLRIGGNVKSESFQSVEHIILGNLTYSWWQVLECCQFLLNIQALQVQYNRIDVLEAPRPELLTNLVMLDLEGNPIKSWTEINKIGNIKSLETLNVSDCGLEQVSLPTPESSSVTPLFENLKNLILTSNQIDNWSSVSELNKLQSLYDLRFKDNPILAKENLETNHQFIIAKISNLQVLNGEIILKEDRRGAEIDYLKHFGETWLGLQSEEEKSCFNKLHPSYQHLVVKYGPPEKNEVKKLPTTLKSQLIEIEIFSSDKTFSKKVPYNMSVQKLSGLIQRLFNTGSSMPHLSCIHAQRPDGLEVALDDTLKDLNFYSVENGDKISVQW